ncbi:MAG: hypothetical protein J6A75_04555 [Lachnospiraceae bacterium]|nr:hypothetical protein [Lachnospiraceae bacterium]
MNEMEKLIAELLHEMDDMSAEVIEEIKDTWLEQLKIELNSTERFQRIEKFVNVVCDVAIDRANRKVVVA